MMKIDSRFDLPQLFEDIGDIEYGVELGVSYGDFSWYLLNNYKKWKFFFGIDEYVERWGGDRDENLYREVDEALGRCPYYELLKLKFSEAVYMFDDEFFDFIFVDGAEGFEDGKTLNDWYPKLRTGGIFSGRAYDSKFPRQIKFLDRFLRDNNITDKLFILNEAGGRDHVKNWYLIK